MNVVRKRLPTPAMLVACIALVVALGGVSYAAGVLPKNSVGTAQLKKKAVTRAKLTRNAVTSAKVKNGTLTATDFAVGQLPAGPKGDPGSPGPAGPAGATGAKGDKGETGSPGTARAYGLVNKAGTSVSHSKNVVSVQLIPPSRYCINLDSSIDPSTTGVLATPEFGSSSTDTVNVAHVEWDAGTSPGCDVAMSTSKVTANGTSLVNTFTPQPFFFVVP